RGRSSSIGNAAPRPCLRSMKKPLARRSGRALTNHVPYARPARRECRLMSKNDRVFVAGHRGMVGSAIMRKLQNHGYTNIITRARNELDLVQQADVRTFFAKERID